METTVTNALQTFTNEEINANVRVIIIEGETWFIAADVCKSLEHSNPTMAVDRLDDDEKAKFNLGLKGGDTNCVNEAGLYNLILGSRKPEAKQFKRWITHDVLPSIRKTGKYQLTEETRDQLIARALIAAKQVVSELTAKVGVLEERVAVQGQQIAEMRPKSAYYDMILNAKGLVSITTIAKDYGMSGQALNKQLHELGIQWKQNRTWVLYQKYADKGYTQTKTTDYQDSQGEYKLVVHTYWTQKGRLFLYALLKDAGILPLIEKLAEKEEEVVA